ncbi:MAG TPA: thioesterase family protein, partial [Acidimicrobiales bacterium]|nr:thioesterase family protein [Acidimicrobiales bacterium]
ETQRPVLWVTVQFAAGASVGERVDCDVEVLAHGHRTSQIRLTALVGDRLVFSAIGAAGLPRERALEVQVATMPEVAAPEDCAEWMPRAVLPAEAGKRGWFDLSEIREVPDVETGMALWARMRGARQSASSLGFLADMVPTAVVRAAGRAGAGTSLDNSIRLGPAPDCEWVLIEFVPYFARAGYLHGSARIWSPDGVHLAVASQTAVAVLFD